MDIGTGIAIAGVWLMVGMFGLSKTITGGGILLAVVVASVVTAILI